MSEWQYQNWGFAQSHTRHKEILKANAFLGESQKLIVRQKNVVNHFIVIIYLKMIFCDYCSIKRNFHIPHFSAALNCQNAECRLKMRLF